MLPVVVLAGGLGTRLASVTQDRLAKALVTVEGRPFIDYKLESLAGGGVEDVLLLVGRHGDQIEQHVEDGKRFGLRVRYRYDGDVLLGTGGAVRAALSMLPDAFWVTYGDTLLDVDLVAAESCFREGAWSGLMTVLENRDQVEHSNVRIEDGRVSSYRKGAPPGTHEFIDYGMLILTQDAFAGTDGGVAFDLAVVFDQLIARGSMGAFVVTEPFRDIGNEEQLAATRAYLRRQPDAD